MDHYASEQEQVDQLKRWWKENGKSLVFGLVIGIGGLAGYRYYEANETARAENASVVYQQFLQLLQEQRVADADSTASALIDAYPDTSYARLSKLMLAKIAVDGGDTERARSLLESLVAEHGDTPINYVARARLARILLAGNDVAGARAMLDGVPAASNERFFELRGDLLRASGETEQARGMYLKAMAQAESLGLERGAIQLKLDNLGDAAQGSGS